MYYLMLIGSFVCITGSALAALLWALKTRQFDASKNGAMLVFDEEEPVGQATDAFPRKRERRQG